MGSQLSVVWIHSENTDAVIQSPDGEGSIAALFLSSLGQEVLSNGPNPPDMASCLGNSWGNERNTDVAEELVKTFVPAKREKYIE